MRMRLGSAVLAVVAGAGLVAACSPSQPGNTTPGDGTSGGGRDGSGSAIDASTIDALSAQDACAQLAIAKCTKLMSCSPTDLERRFIDLGSCETREALACTDEQAAVDTAATPGGALACGDAITAGTCTEFLGATAPSACQAPSGPLSGSCAFGAQCTTGFCAIGANALCGLCRSEPVVGTSCAASACGSGLVCAANQTCVTPGPATAACNENAPCENGLTCVGRTKTTNGSCKPEITTSGGNCDPNHKSLADCSADDGLACNHQSNKCVAIGLAAAGATCGLVNNVKTVCTGGASCNQAQGAQTGTCVAAAGDGSACDTKAGPDCLTPARCIPALSTGGAGTCELPGSLTCQ